MKLPKFFWLKTMDRGILVFVVMLNLITMNLGIRKGDWMQVLASFTWLSCICVIVFLNQRYATARIKYHDQLRELEKEIDAKLEQMRRYAPNAKLPYLDEIH